MEKRAAKLIDSKADDNFQGIVSFGLGADSYQTLIGTIALITSGI